MYTVSLPQIILFIQCYDVIWKGKRGFIFAGDLSGLCLNWLSLWWYKNFVELQNIKVVFCYLQLSQSLTLFTWCIYQELLSLSQVLGLSSIWNMGQKNSMVCYKIHFCSSCAHHSIGRMPTAFRKLQESLLNQQTWWLHCSKRQTWLW